MPPQPEANTPPLLGRLGRELLSWLWVAVAFLLITGTIVQARVIPSESMERTFLVGDHLLMDRFGYDAALPFTPFHIRLWRQPRRQQVIIFRDPLPGPREDFIKRLIGLPGDIVAIRRGIVYIDGKRLAEPYRMSAPNPADNFGPVTVPARSYFVLGDNRNDSYDSRYWGFVPETNLIGTPMLIYLSVRAPDGAWQPGQLRERFLAYLDAALHPNRVRWNRLFKVL